MAINNHFFSIDWSHVDEINQHEDFLFIFDHLDEDTLPEWIKEDPFGEEEHYMFCSWRGLMVFKDWFDLVRKSIDQELVARFTSLYSQVGLLMTMIIPLILFLKISP